MQYRRPLIAIGILLFVGAAGCALITQPLVRSIPSEPAKVAAGFAKQTAALRTRT